MQLQETAAKLAELRTPQPGQHAVQQQQQQSTSAAPAPETRQLTQAGDQLAQQARDSSDRWDEQQQQDSAGQAGRSRRKAVAASPAPQPQVSRRAARCVTMAWSSAAAFNLTPLCLAQDVSMHDFAATGLSQGHSG